ncbi:Peptidyl-prolyl cis-trans isomerase-like 4 [Coemansia sp. RSA 521]|nr:Peptidyl-prolyl cis-trans isomerase-like 4 [Coemansia sp. RSA 521]
MSVLLETSLGDIVIDLYTEETPLVSKNFLKLCKAKYYNFTFFHRVDRGFIAQAGDPTGTGTGGESIYGVMGGSPYIPTEIRPQLKHRLGTVSMATLGTTNMIGSQFFIGLSDNIDYLDGKHTVFGRIAEGMDVVHALDECVSDKDKRPLRDILIRHTIVLDDPFDDPPHMPRPSSPLLPTKSQQDMMRIEANYEQVQVDGDTERRARDARAQALTLEMIGDLPYADVKPPENILFVCKLNPLTQSDDLRTIFSRFGALDSCDIVCDRDTGASLGYAFVEFQDKQACEEAYFKMENVLVDDRRIHVDFSQSVSRVGDKWVRIKEGRNVQMKSKYREGARQERDRYDMVFDTEKRRDRRDRRRSRSPARSSRRRD